MKEFKGICPKCKSDNIEIYDEGGSATGDQDVFYWKCHACKYEFQTQKIEMIV